MLEPWTSWEASNIHCPIHFLYNKDCNVCHPHHHACHPHLVLPRWCPLLCRDVYTRKGFISKCFCFRCFSSCSCFCSGKRRSRSWGCPLLRQPKIYPTAHGHLCACREKSGALGDATFTNLHCVFECACFSHVLSSIHKSLQRPALSSSSSLTWEVHLHSSQSPAHYHFISSDRICVFPALTALGPQLVPIQGLWSLIVRELIPMLGWQL